MSDSRAKAATIAGELADRLSDPAAVEVAVRAGFDRARANGVQSADVAPWQSYSLNGHAGVALLHAESGHSRVAHRHLSAAASSASQAAGLHTGLAGLAFAARRSRRRRDEYRGLLGHIDDRVGRRARALLEQEDARCRRLPLKPTSNHIFDAISGLAGIGRYALWCAEQDGEAELISAILSALTRLVRPSVVDGVEVPGWWAVNPPFPGSAGESLYRHGHLNFGLAHGIAGPLALLSTAWLRGIRVDGHDEAVEHFVDVLLASRRSDGYGPYWPGNRTLTQIRLGEATSGNPDRVAWCYGAPGIARAVQLAGLALKRTTWATAALEATRAAFARPESMWMVGDASLCHGWAGLLQTLTRIVDDGRDRVLEGEMHRVAARLVDLYQPDAPFGYRFQEPRTGRGLDEPGLLNGAAGIALALNSYANTTASAAGWDAALLLTLILSRSGTPSTCQRRRFGWMRRTGIVALRDDDLAALVEMRRTAAAVGQST
ncbi:MAG: lanthionine synthetase C family protein [Stackebrandtia sp.]